MQITLNSEQKHFVISMGNSVSCLGFHVVYEQTCELVRRIKSVSDKVLQTKGLSSLRDMLAPSPEQIGTMAQYEQYRGLLAKYALLDDDATWFDARTPTKVQKVLETARKSDDIMRVFLGDTATGRDWLDEYDTIGRIRRSAGTMKSPLLVPAGEYGGPALLTHCILRIINVTTGEECYRHPNYQLPKMELHEAASYDQAEGYTHCVKVANKSGELESYANFKSMADAAHWLAFMSGNSHDYHTGN